jgi:hypothetical protein
MEVFNSKINEVRDVLRKDGVTGIDSINHCVAFYILRNLTVELCDKFGIDHKYAFVNFTPFYISNADFYIVLTHIKISCNSFLFFLFYSLEHIFLVFRKHP